jgi:hypothetical protein
MDLIDTIKKLKNIEADKEFTRTSRSLILNTRREIKLNFWGLLLRSIELGVSLALAGLLIFMTLGGFSAWRFLSPLQITVNLDPVSLRAEAQAIDIQIQLANLNYNEGALGLKSGESTPASIGQSKQGEEAAAANTSPKTENSSTTNALSVDEALQKLSE